ncbi:hypothetical protein [Marinilactibacillus piezotolerans]|uniref:hypothetical protein n=1 Tax=Marinilactibacillus piezotolerans TaxID=258723 RepID=UPI0009AF4297|nr:hypothetical protein [Marinilactibacillus piezotolerans]
MKNITYKIFNQTVQMNYDNSEFSAILIDELNLYPIVTDKEKVDLSIFVNPKVNIEEQYNFSRNPKEHYFDSDVFGLDFYWGKVFWVFNKNEIYVYPNKYKYNYLRQSYVLMRDIQFSLPDQAAGQKIHEDILVGNILFRDNMFVLHGSAMATKDGRVAMVGGTGGTGKTSTLLSLGQREDIFFVCDDLCVLNDEGKVFVNYAYPKIYAYNTIGSKNFEKKILNDDGLFGRFQWNLRKKINPSKVRRRRNPHTLYQIMPEEDLNNLKLNTYVILNRDDKVAELSVEKIDADKACEMSYYIIRNEMNKFFVPLSYRNLNALYNNSTNQFDPDDIFMAWKQRMSTVFEGTSTYKINIPFHYDNENLKIEMEKILCDLIGL